MRCCEWAVGVCWYKVVCCEWVIGSFAFATYPAGDSGVSDLFGSLLVIAFVVRSVWFRVLLIPKCLASCAACGVACKCSAVEAWALYPHGSTSSRRKRNGLRLLLRHGVRAVLWLVLCDLVIVQGRAMSKLLRHGRCGRIASVVLLVAIVRGV